MVQRIRHQLSTVDHNSHVALQSQKPVSAMNSSIKQSKAVFRQCANHPWYAACLLLLSVVVVLGGPWACIVHCLMLDIEHHGHHHHEQHGVGASGFLADCPTVLSGGDQQLPESPSALTIAIVLPLVLAPLLFDTKLQRLAYSAQRASTIHPPPRDPPRISISFA